jgi:hypothetical protein
MQHKHASAILALTLFAPFRGPALAQDSVEAGFIGQSLPYPGLSVTGTLAGGDIIAFDGLSIDRFSADGDFVKNLGSFGAFVFNGCFAIAPDETYAIVGETSTHDIFKVPLDGSGMTFLTNMVYNYSAAFAPSGELFVSAAVCGFGCGNDIIEVDLQSGAQRKVAAVQGPSGPIAFDTLGNMYYATVDEGFPPPLASTEILIFLAADISTADCGTGTCLTETSALTFATGYDGASDLVFDSGTGFAYLAENNFSNGANRIWRVTGGAASPNDILVDGVTFNWISNLEFRASSTAATFEGYQPAAVATIHYSSTDFFSAWTRYQVQPLRAGLSLSGAGATGPGVGSFDVTGGVPGGAALFFFGPTALKGPSETAYSLAGIGSPLFSDLNIASVSVLPGMIASDGVGAASYGFTNPGGIAGLFSVQALLIDSNMATVIGATPSVDL